MVECTYYACKKEATHYVVDEDGNECPGGPLCETCGELVVKGYMKLNGKKCQLELLKEK